MIGARPMRGRSGAVPASWRPLAYSLGAVAVLATLVLGVSTNASARGSLQVSPSTALAQKQRVTVTGRGLSGGSYGNVVECNLTPGEPSELVGTPFNETVPVGCTAPSLKTIDMVSSSGTMTATFEVLIHVKRGMGPPCGTKNVWGRCKGADSSGGSPRADARNYPCPPTGAQVLKGGTCALVFYDNAGDVVSAPISFAEVAAKAKH